MPGSNTPTDGPDEWLGVMALALDGFQQRLRTAEKTAYTLLPNGVTPGDLRTLRVCSAVGKAGVSAIAEALGTSQPAATVAVARLEARGFIARLPCDNDRRRKGLVLTDQGETLERLHIRAEHLLVQQILKVIPTEEREQVVALFARLSADSIPG